MPNVTALKTQMDFILMFKSKNKNPHNIVMLTYIGKIYAGHQGFSFFTASKTSKLLTGIEYDHIAAERLGNLFIFMD